MGAASAVMHWVTPDCVYLTMHGNIMLKSYYDMNWFILVHYKPEFGNLNSNLGDHILHSVIMGYACTMYQWYK